MRADIGKIKKLPVGIENFEKLRKEDFYYIDKTAMIRDLLQRWGEWTSSPGLADLVHL